MTLEPGIAFVPLGMLAKIKTNFKDADFWLKRRGSKGDCGHPIREFHKEDIGVKVERTDILVPNYLYYLMLHLYNEGHWRQFEGGTTCIVNIKVQDVKDLTFQIEVMIDMEEE